jgi:hypothetical protein
MDKLATFWGGDHQLSKASDAISDNLMPMSGNCASLQGELFRASTRISYDWFNNGWGCNNWSGAVVFLQKFFGKLPVQPSAETLADLDKNLAFVYNFSHGERTSCLNEDDADAAVTRIHEVIVQALVNNPKLIPNTCNMFDFQEKDAPYEEDDEEEEEDHGDEDEDE